MKTILIAEDDRNLTTALTIRLQAAGYLVISRADGLRSFLTAASARPDLILMDVGLPFADGFSVAKELNAANLHEIPVIFMTARKHAEAEARAQGLGAAAFLEKPFQSETLLATIEQALATRSPAPAHRATQAAEPRARP